MVQWLPPGEITLARREHEVCECEYTHRGQGTI